MVGTAAHGQLNARSGARGLRFALATPADDAAIRRLLRTTPMRGAITLTFEREPNYFCGASVAGAEDHTIVAKEGDTLLCIGRCTTRSTWVNGQIRRVGYLAELRLAESAHGRLDVLRGGYRFFHALHEASPAEWYFTSIASDNRRARRFARLRSGCPDGLELGPKRNQEDSERGIHAREVWSAGRRH